ncbi:hypothetical protein [Halosolutus gelatinilyticus]
MPARFKAIPYYARTRREPGEMRVWIRSQHAGGERE